jgi:hypothetical protein
MADAAPFLYNGTLPGPAGSIAPILAETPIATQRNLATNLFTFLTSENKQLLQLNVDPTPTTCIIGIPNSSKIRVLHCMGIGSCRIGENSPIDGKLLLLHGDGNREIGAPNPLVLPAQYLDKTEKLCMTRAQFDANLAATGGAYTWPLTPRIRAHEENNWVSIMHIAPIPSFLVLDGLVSDIDAAELIERVDGLDDSTGDMYSHLKDFLLSCLTGHNQGDVSPRISQELLCAPNPNLARLWAQSTFANSYPTLQPPPVAPPQENGIPNNIAAILAQFVALQQNGNPPNPGGGGEEEKKDEEDNNNLNMSQSMLEATREMCGLPLGADVQLLPAWFRLCAAKGTSDAYKKILIRKHIMSHFRYEDAQVPLTNNILQMASKQNWLGTEANVDCPSLVNAGDGLSPFIVVDLNEDEVAQLNADDEALALASAVTASDLLARNKKRKASVPKTAEAFLLMLLRYTNLLFALFSADCPLYKCMVQVVTAIKAFSRSAREQMSQTTKASILWVILKQSRHFAIGQMDVLQEFRGMHESLAYKTLGFSHAETPAALLVDKVKASDKKRKPDAGDTAKPAAPGAEAKKPKPAGTNENRWHPKIKEALQPGLRAANNPGFLQVMTYCEQDPTALYPIFGRKCVPNCFFGTCYRGRECPRDHSNPTEEQIEKILSITKKFRDNPTGLLQG